MYGYKNRNEAQPCYVLLEAKCCCFHLVIMFVVLVWPIVRRSWRFSRSNTHIIFQLFRSLFVFIFHSKRSHRLVLAFVLWKMSSLENIANWLGQLHKQITINRLANWLESIFGFQHYENHLNKSKWEFLIHIKATVAWISFGYTVCDLKISE